MVSVENLLNTLKKNNISFFSGVPDSILKHLSTSFDNLNLKNHKLAVNEGSAVAMGIGHYLETKKVPCVYMQNGQNMALTERPCMVLRCVFFVFFCTFH